jgi:hypothetical protein
VGKQVDLILADLTAPNLSPVLEAPVRNIVPNLGYAGSGHEVKMVIVAGVVLVRDWMVLTADEDAIRADAQLEAEAVPSAWLPIWCTRRWPCWRQWRRDGCERQKALFRPDGP